MIRQIPGTIYPAEHRQVVDQQTVNVSSFSTDSMPGTYGIVVFDVALGPSASYQLDTEALHSILVLPVYGGVKLRREAKDSRSDTYAYAGRAVRADFIERADAALINPLGSYWSSAIIIGIRRKNGIAAAWSLVELSRGFDVAFRINELQAVHFGQGTASGRHLFDSYIGNFQCRGEYLLPVAWGRKVFILVIQGVFEVEGRLLCSKDALMLWDTPSVSLEALADGSMVLVICALQ